MSTPLPPAAIKLHHKTGKHDCAIACLASYLRVDPEEVLIAAARTIKPGSKFWETGLSGPEIVRVAKRLGFQVKWRKVSESNPDALEEATGIVDIRLRAKADIQHAVLMVEGAIYDPDDHPITRWDAALFWQFYNAYPVAILEMVE